MRRVFWISKLASKILVSFPRRDRAPDRANSLKFSKNKERKTQNGGKCNEHKPRRSVGFGESPGGSRHHGEELIRGGRVGRALRREVHQEATPRSRRVPVGRGSSQRPLPIRKRQDDKGNALRVFGARECERETAHDPSPAGTASARQPAEVRELRAQFLVFQPGVGDQRDCEVPVVSDVFGDRSELRG